MLATWLFRGILSFLLKVDVVMNDDATVWFQVNTLQQLQNIASYQFLKDKLESGKVHLHALWFDIHDGDFYMFSRSQQCFLNVTEEHYEQLVADSEGQMQWFVSF